MILNYVIFHIFDQILGLMVTVKVIFLKIVRLVDVVRFQYYEYNIVCDRTETRSSNYRQNGYF